MSRLRQVTWQIMAYLSTLSLGIIIRPAFGTEAKESKFVCRKLVSVLLLVNVATTKWF